MPFLETTRNIYRKWKRIEVVNVTLRQFVKLLDREFLSKAENSYELEEIIDTVNGGGLLGKRIRSKSGAYELLRSPSAGILYFLGFRKNSVMIYDKKAKRDFRYEIYMYQYKS